MHRGAYTGYDARLHELAERFKGVDGSPTAANTVLFALTDVTMVDTALNWACWAKHHGLKFFLWTTDAETHRRISEAGLPSFFDIANTTAHENVHYESDNKAHIWTKSGFQKMEGVYRLLSLGYDVFLSDVDLVFARNPWPTFVRDADLEYHVETSTGNVKETPDIQINFGYFLVRSSDLMSRLFKNTLHRERSEGTVEQNLFNAEMRDWRKRGDTHWLNSSQPPLTETERRGLSVSGDANTQQKLVYRMKSVWEFPSGGVAFHPGNRKKFVDYIAQHHVEPVIAHFNLIAGNERKAACMKRFGYWRLDDATGQCLESATIDYTTHSTDCPTFMNVDV